MASHTYTGALIADVICFITVVEGGALGKAFQVGDEGVGGAGALLHARPAVVRGVGLALWVRGGGATAYALGRVGIRVAVVWAEAHAGAGGVVGEEELVQGAFVYAGTGGRVAVLGDGALRDAKGCESVSEVWVWAVQNTQVLDLDSRCCLYFLQRQTVFRTNRYTSSRNILSIGRSRAQFYAHLCRIISVEHWLVWANSNTLSCCWIAKVGCRTGNSTITSYIICVRVRTVWAI